MPAEQTEKKGAERRGSVRYPCSAESFSTDNSCRPITATKREAWTAIIRDLSTGGMGIIVPRRFEPGTLLTIDLEDAARTSHNSFVVRVMHITQETENSWLLGCAFTSKLSEAELLSLM
ncbi:MAG: PilZ domain-containing protein [Planctomycetia bacterium]|nr:PilZ domain-containing protein [Planctomycetia bacterium]